MYFEVNDKTQLSSKSKLNIKLSYTQSTWANSVVGGLRWCCLRTVWAFVETVVRTCDDNTLRKSWAQLINWTQTDNPFCLFAVTGRRRGKLEKRGRDNDGTWIRKKGKMCWKNNERLPEWTNYPTIIVSQASFNTLLWVSATMCVCTCMCCWPSFVSVF